MYLHRANEACQAGESSISVTPKAKLLSLWHSTRWVALEKQKASVSLEDTRHCPKQLTDTYEATDKLADSTATTYRMSLKTYTS